MSIPLVQAGHDCNVFDAMDVLKTKIELLSANGPSEGRTLETISSALTRAVVKQPWATEMVSNQKSANRDMPKFAHVLKAKVRTLMQKFPNGVARIEEQDVSLGKPAGTATYEEIMHVNFEPRRDAPPTSSVLFSEHRRFLRSRSQTNVGRAGARGSFDTQSRRSTPRGWILHAPDTIQQA